MKLNITKKVQDLCCEITVKCNFTEIEEDEKGRHTEIFMYATTYFDGVFFGTVERVTWFRNSKKKPKKEELLYWDEWEDDSLEHFIFFMKEQYDEYMRIGKDEYLRLMQEGKIPLPC